MTYDLHAEFDRYADDLLKTGHTIQTYERWLEQQVLAARQDRDICKAKLKNCQLDMAALLRPPERKMP